MPIFEYRCRQCGEVFERLVLSARETVECPSCASRSLAKLLSATNTPRTAPAAARSAGAGGSCCSGGGCGCHN